MKGMKRSVLTLALAFACFVLLEVVPLEGGRSSQLYTEVLGVSEGPMGLRGLQTKHEITFLEVWPGWPLVLECRLETNVQGVEDEFAAAMLSLWFHKDLSYDSPRRLSERFRVTLFGWPWETEGDWNVDANTSWICHRPAPEIRERVDRDEAVTHKLVTGSGEVVARTDDSADPHHPLGCEGCEEEESDSGESGGEKACTDCHGSHAPELPPEAETADCASCHKE